MKLQEGRFIQGLRNMFSLRWDMADPDEIHNTIISGAKLQGTNMCILMLAILIASIGLNMNSTAVIIGAMLISPLMGGITAIGYGIATNDLTLSKGRHECCCDSHAWDNVAFLLTGLTYYAGKSAKKGNKNVPRCRCGSGEKLGGGCGDR